jgi:hypothetical protein
MSGPGIGRPALPTAANWAAAEHNPAHKNYLNKEQQKYLNESAAEGLLSRSTSGNTAVSENDPDLVAAINNAVKKYENALKAAAAAKPKPKKKFGCTISGGRRRRKTRRRANT